MSIWTILVLIYIIIFVLIVFGAGVYYINERGDLGDVFFAATLNIIFLMWTLMYRIITYLSKRKILSDFKEEDMLTSEHIETYGIKFKNRNSLQSRLKY